MSRQKKKGTGYENEVRDYLACQDIRPDRCGKIVGHPGDVSIKTRLVGICEADSWSGPYYIECKRRATAWTELYKWLDTNRNDFLAIRADYQRSLIVMDIEQFKSLLLGELPKPRRE